MGFLRGVSRFPSSPSYSQYRAALFCFAPQLVKCCYCSPTLPFWGVYDTDISCTERETHLICGSAAHLGRGHWTPSQKLPARMHGGDDIDRNKQRNKGKGWSKPLSLVARSAFRSLAVFSPVTLEGGVSTACLVMSRVLCSIYARVVQNSAYNVKHKCLTFLVKWQDRPKRPNRTQELIMNQEATGKNRKNQEDIENILKRPGTRRAGTMWSGLFCLLNRSKPFKSAEGQGGGCVGFCRETNNQNQRQCNPHDADQRKENKRVTEKRNASMYKHKKRK